MSERSVRLIAAAAVISAAISGGCVDSRSRPTAPVFGTLAVLSDPSGADIIVDGRSLGTTTPDTVGGVPAGPHLLQLSLQIGASEFFAWEDSVVVPEERMLTVDAALEGGCHRDCPFLIDVGRIDCRVNTAGDTCAGAFFSQPALRWPGPTGGAYAAGGRLLVAAILGADAGDLAGDTVATQVFRLAWTGRRPVALSSGGGRQTLEREYWATGLFTGSSLLGLSVRETALAVDSAGVEDVLFIHYQVENVSADERYRQLHPIIPPGGYTFGSLYLGFGLDADVGAAADDLGTVEPGLNLAFMYDADFSDAELGAAADRPALVGLVTLEPPAGAAERTLTLWRSADDWDNGSRHDFAWRLLAGRLGAGDPIADHPSPDIGFQPTQPADYRLIEAHGPLQLAPGESVTLTVALVLAGPVAGSFTPGQLVPPGDPESATRQILAVAADLRALAAQLPDLWARFRP